MGKFANRLRLGRPFSRRAADRTIRLRLAPQGDGVALTVEDSGPGLDGDAGRLFHPFQRGADHSAPPGLGLGLTLVQALARAHGGTIAYAPASGGAGAIFTVTFPA